MISLKDVIQVWMATNKNLSRSWQLAQDPDDTWILKPKEPKFYKNCARAIVMLDRITLHYDDDNSCLDRGCHSEIILAYDPTFFQKLSKWMRFVRRR